MKEALVNTKDPLQERDIRMEIMRVSSMLMILMLHYLNNGNILEKTNYGGGSFMLVWSIEAICFPAVNCFMLITGYLLSTKRFSWRRPIRLYLQVLFYTVMISIIAVVSGIFRLGITDVLSVFPVAGRENWYVTSYFGVLFISPVLNIAVDRMGEKQLRNVLLSLFGIFSLVPTLFFWVDQFRLAGGYSVLWYVFMYLCGAYIRKYSGLFRISKWWVVLLIILPISRILCREVGVYIPLAANAESFMYRYNTLPVFVASLIFFQTVLGMKEKRRSELGQKIIRVLGRTAFGVFYIHSFFMIRDFLWVRMGSEKFLNTGLQIPHGVMCIVIVYLLCSIIDICREKLFSIVRLDRLAEVCGEKLDLHFSLNPQQRES